jgi:hypothetical protein
MHKLGAEIEAIRARIGRLPNDEQELVALRGQPMPPYFRAYQTHYYRHNKDAYRIDAMVPDFWGNHGDIFGWIVHYSGPGSPRPFWVILF